MNTHKKDTSLDSLIAQLNMMTTDFIFSGHTCQARASAIAHKLYEICQHIELTFFPEQQVVYFKMLKVWQSLAKSSMQNPQENSQTESEVPSPASVH
jgi:hypothetical protein